MHELTGNATQTLLKAVAEQTEVQSKKMGRGFASGHEAWARLKQLSEEAKIMEKSLETLLPDLWSSVKDGDAGAVGIYLREIGNKAEEICMGFVTIAAEAHRAAEEL